MANAYKPLERFVITMDANSYSLLCAGEIYQTLLKVGAHTWLVQRRRRKG